MANITVNPFGTDGHLPGSIGIINDLTTGGADKALSAEMGKRIGNKIDSLSGLFTTVDLELTPVGADSSYENTYLKNNGESAWSQYYDTYVKAFPEGGKIKYSINYANLGIFISDTGDLSGAKTSVAYNGSSPGEYVIPEGKYLIWDVYRSNPSNISIKMEVSQVKDFATDDDLQPIEAAITSLEAVAEQIVTTKVTKTATGTVGSFWTDVNVTTDKPFRVSIELLSGKYSSNVGFYVNIFYSDNPSNGIQMAHNSLSFDESAYFYPSKEVSKIAVHSSVGFDISSQVKITVEILTDLWQKIYFQRKPWSGKKIICFGDSITELFDGALMTWPDHLARTTGAEVVNLALGGTCIKPRNYANPNTTDWAYSKVDILNAVKAVVGGDGSAAFTSYEEGMTYIYDHVNQLIAGKENVLRILEDARATDLSEVDAIVIFAGFNDWYQAWFTKEQVYAALVEMVQTVSAAYPNVQVYYCNPMPCFLNNVIDAEHFTTNFTRGGVSQEDFCANMNEIGGGNMLVNVFDSYHLMGINAYNGLFYYTANDGVHPWRNTKTIGRKIGAWLNSKYCI